ncbi:MAG: hypothetical protein IPJ89_02545 [Candidatus Iainarchaeum archaeon]|uniref:Uncharacterized protein n=1 Tax=Candidatus Iainarchaeum sp. TaxID=3101447 RepID=A0A7T9DKP6_9ARCH|nr:MAG: hypothetical protein IPJ89_02545 [Candidatus Diapherotrites archaeon]
MKNESYMKLNIKAFAFASAAIGFLASIFMGGAMRAYALNGMGWMLNGGIQTGGIFNVFMGVWMVVILGIIGGAFAWVYNWLCEN